MEHVVYEQPATDLGDQKKNGTNFYRRKRTAVFFISFRFFPSSQLHPHMFWLDIGKHTRRLRIQNNPFRPHYN